MKGWSRLTIALVLSLALVAGLIYSGRSKALRYLEPIGLLTPPLPPPLSLAISTQADSLLQGGFLIDALNRNRPEGAPQVVLAPVARPYDAARLLVHGEVSMALVGASVLPTVMADLAAKGETGSTPLLIARVGELTSTLLVREGSRIGGLKDLAGQRVGVSSSVPSDLRVLRELLGSVGLELREARGGAENRPSSALESAGLVSVVQAEPDELLAQLKDGKISALFTVALHPSGQIHRYGHALNLTIVPLAPDMEKLALHHPEYSESVIVGEAYPEFNQRGDIPTVGTGVWLLTASSASKSQLADLTRRLVQSIPELQKLSVFRLLTPASLIISLEESRVHPGALSVYHEMGLNGIQRIVRREGLTAADGVEALLPGSGDSTSMLAGSLANAVTGALDQVEQAGQTVADVVGPDGTQPPTSESATPGPVQASPVEGDVDTPHASATPGIDSASPLPSPNETPAPTEELATKGKSAPSPPLVAPPVQLLPPFVIATGKPDHDAFQVSSQLATVFNDPCDRTGPRPAECDARLHHWSPQALILPTIDDAGSLDALLNRRVSLALVRADVLYEAQQREKEGAEQKERGGSDGRMLDSTLGAAPLKARDVRLLGQLYVHSLTAIGRRQQQVDSRPEEEPLQGSWTSVSEQLELLRDKTRAPLSETRPDMATQHLRRSRLADLTDMEGMRTSLRSDKLNSDRGNAITLFEPIRFLSVLWRQSLLTDEPFPLTAAQLFNEGRIDGLICSLAHPSPWLSAQLKWEADTTLLPITGLEREIDESPYLVQTTLRREWYNNTEGAVRTLGVPVLLVGTTETPAELVLEFVNLLLNEQKQLARAAPQLWDTSLSVLHAGTFVPFHPVAESRYRLRERREISSDSPALPSPARQKTPQ